jgi:hypothetical protein
MDERSFDARLRALVNRCFFDLGRAPTPAELASRSGDSLEAVERALRRLETRLSVTLRPGTSEIWTAPPFSATPTIHYVSCARGEFFGACAWCALGVAVLGGLPARIRTRSGGEQDLVLELDGKPPDAYVHFAVPPARWAQSLVWACSTILFFSDAAEVPGWCQRRGVARGATLTLAQTLELARAWFGDNLAPEAHTRGRAGTQAIFDRVGLTDPFWRL